MKESFSLSIERLIALPSPASDIFNIRLRIKEFRGIIIQYTEVVCEPQRLTLQFCEICIACILQGHGSLNNITALNLLNSMMPFFVVSFIYVETWVRNGTGCVSPVEITYFATYQLAVSHTVEECHFFMGIPGCCLSI